MPTWTHETLQQVLQQGRVTLAPHAPVREAAGANLEPVLRKHPLAKKLGKEKDPAVCVVRITSLRRRFADEDGLIGKYHLDAIKNSGLLLDDSPNYVRYFIRQKKVRNKSEEGTLIEVIPINRNQDEQLYRTVHNLIDSFAKPQDHQG